MRPSLRKPESGWKIFNSLVSELPLLRGTGERQHPGQHYRSHGALTPDHLSIKSRVLHLKESRTHRRVVFITGAHRRDSTLEQ